MAYFAGLIDGEAHIGLLRTKRTDRDGQMRFIPRIMISMLKKERNDNVLLELQEKIGGTFYLRKPFEYKDRKRITHKDQVCLELRGYKAIDALRLLKPYLRIKKEHAEIILGLEFRSRFRVSSSQAKEREDAYWNIRCLNDSRRTI